MQKELIKTTTATTPSSTYKLISKTFRVVPDIKTGETIDLSEGVKNGEWWKSHYFEGNYEKDEPFTFPEFKEIAGSLVHIVRSTLYTYSFNRFVHYWMPLDEHRGSTAAESHQISHLTQMDWDAAYDNFAFEIAQDLHHIPSFTLSVQRERYNWGSGERKSEGKGNVLSYDSSGLDRIWHDRIYNGFTEVIESSLSREN